MVAVAIDAISIYLWRYVRDYRFGCNYVARDEVSRWIQ